jgi:phosphopantetheinyl transferase
MDYLIYSLAELRAAEVDTAVLSAEELATAQKRGADYAMIRSVLKHELARRCGCDARDITFCYGEHGKPHCDRQPFNLSHSGDCLCLAFHHSDIGVDVERERPRNFAALAARFMCPGQYAAFESRGFPQEEFYSCWCAAEALVKLAGDTMWHAHDYPFLYEHGKIKCLFSPSLEVLLFIPMEGYRGAVAYR